MIAHPFLLNKQHWKPVRGEIIRAAPGWVGFSDAERRLAKLQLLQ
jgi:hypothetical protein